MFVSVPPSVRTSPASGQVTARKGGSVTLECKASGNPVPSIRWTRKVSVKNCVIILNFLFGWFGVLEAKYDHVNYTFKIFVSILELLFGFLLSKFHSCIFKVSAWFITKENRIPL